MKELIKQVRAYAFRTHCWDKDESELLHKTADAIEKLQAENEDLSYTLEGVMHSVDKWLDDGDYSPNRVQRAATMREKTLQIVERLQAENERLRKENDRLLAHISQKILDTPPRIIMSVEEYEKWRGLSQEEKQ